jgi:hypothetical protein
MTLNFQRPSGRQQCRFFALSRDTSHHLVLIAIRLFTKSRTCQRHEFRQGSMPLGRSIASMAPTEHIHRLQDLWVGDQFFLAGPGARDVANGDRKRRNISPTDRLNLVPASARTSTPRSRYESDWSLPTGHRHCPSRKFRIRSLWG